MQNRIEEIIDEISNFVDSCKPARLSPGMILVPKDQLLEMLDELKGRTPEVIKRYQRIVANRETIVSQAESDAQQIKADAEEQAKQLINDTEIMHQAYDQARDLVANAIETSRQREEESKQQAETIRVGILSYANDMLSVSLDILQSTYNETKQKSEALIDELKASIDEMVKNRQEIVDQLNGPGYITSSEAHEEEYTEDDFKVNYDGSGDNF